MKRKPYHVVDGLEVATGFDLSVIDDVAYGDTREESGYDDFGDEALHRRWFEQNPSIYTFLHEGNAIAGYINAMPLVDQQFQNVLDGELRDGQIQPADIRRYDAPGEYKLYLCSVALLPQYRSDVSALFTLYAGMRRKFEMLRVRGARISELACVAWTPAGRLICHSFGMVRYGKHRQRGDVYHGLILDGVLPDY